MEAEKEIFDHTVTKVDFYILAKWHRILSQEGPILSSGIPVMSVHPSLLPAFIGGHAIRDAYGAGAKVAGATAHLVTRGDKGIDEGPKLLQVPKNVGNLLWPGFEKTVQFAEREAIYYAARIMAESRYLVYTDPVSGTRKTYIF
jgi:folate-dependent phosphoribosylglycinamide formyltransferase PurN